MRKHKCNSIYNETLCENNDAEFTVTVYLMRYDFDWKCQTCHNTQDQDKDLKFVKKYM